MNITTPLIPYNQLLKTVFKKNCCPTGQPLQNCPFDIIPFIEGSVVLPDASAIWRMNWNHYAEDRDFIVDVLAPSQNVPVSCSNWFAAWVLTLSWCKRYPLSAGHAFCFGLFDANFSSCQNKMIHILSQLEIKTTSKITFLSQKRGLVSFGQTLFAESSIFLVMSNFAIAWIDVLILTSRSPSKSLVTTQLNNSSSFWFVFL